MTQRYVAYREVWVTVDYEGEKRVEPRIIVGYGDSQEEADRDAERQVKETEDRDKANRNKQ